MGYKNFPISLTKNRGYACELVGASRTPGRTVSGAMPAARVDGGGLWTVQWDGLILNDAYVRLWRKWASYLADGARPVILPIRTERVGPKLIVDGAEVTGDPIPFSDGAFFSDGSGFSQPSIIVLTNSAAALRATSISVRVYAGGEIYEGMDFSIQHPVLSHRLYRIVGRKKTKSVERGDPFDQYQLTIEPPLREGISATVQLNFDQPLCVVQLMQASAMASKLDILSMATPSASFQESFLPPPPT